MSDFAQRSQLRYLFLPGGLLLPQLPVGSVTVGLADFADNCKVAGANPEGTRDRGRLDVRESLPNPSRLAQGTMEWIGALAAGQHTIELQSVANNCDVDLGRLRIVVVPLGGTSFNSGRPLAVGARSDDMTEAIDRPDLSIAPAWPR